MIHRLSVVVRSAERSCFCNTWCWWDLIYASCRVANCRSLIHPLKQRSILLAQYSMSYTGRRPVDCAFRGLPARILCVSSRSRPSTGQTPLRTGLPEGRQAERLRFLRQAIRVITLSSLVTPSLFCSIGGRTEHAEGRSPHLSRIGEDKCCK